jgi:hypothetical protein
MLTGKPAYDAATSEQAERQAAAAALRPALARLQQCRERLRRRGLGDGLVTLAEWCLKPRPDERPRDAGVVARAVIDYQAAEQERARQAQLERVRAEAWAAARWRLTVGVAAFVLLATLWGSVHYWQNEVRLADARSAIDASLLEFDDKLARSDLHEAAEALGRAEARSADAPADRRERIRRARERLEVARRLDAIWQVGFAIKEGKLDFDPAADGYARLFREHFEVEPYAGEPGPVARRLAESRLKEHWLIALDHWAAAARDGGQRRWLLKVADLADPDERRVRCRAAVVNADAVALRALAREAQADVGASKPHVLWLLGRSLRKLGKRDDWPLAIGLLTLAQERHRNDFWINFELANALLLYSGFSRDQRREHLWNAVAHYQAALAIRPDSAVASYNLGLARRELGQFAAAARDLRRAEGMKALAARDENVHSGADVLRETERMAELDGAWPELLAGKQPEAPADRLALAKMCQIRGHYARSAGLYESAFRGDPALEEAVDNRYAAACAAALAGAGEGGLGTEQERRRWRQLARDWLRADLNALKGLKDVVGVKEGLRSRLNDPDLAGVRDEGAMKELGLDERERQECRRLWEAVQELLRRAPRDG